MQTNSGLLDNARLGAPFSFSADWQLYDPGLFVERQNAYGELYGLLVARTRDAKRLISLVAPPGLGKTWLLHYTREQLADARAVLWVDITQLMTNETKSISYKALGNWLTQTVSDVAPRCSILSELRPGEVEALMLLDLFVTYLCDKCNFEQPPVVFVDGYDSYDEGQLAELEDIVLRRLLSKQCMKMVICHRSDQKPSPQLLSPNRAMIQLDVFASDTTSASGHSVIERQFDSLRKTYFSSMVIAARAMTSLPMFRNYQWNHPFINAFLSIQFLLSTQRDSLPALSREHLQACCLELINRPNPTTGEARRRPIMTMDDVAILEDISFKLPEQWTIQELEKVVNLKFHSQVFRRLYDCRAIVKEQKTYQEYRVADGLRELLMDLKAMESNS